MSQSQNAPGSGTVGEHAVAFGGSVAGLLAARVLADAYEHVTIIERDELPAVGQNRRAVPQGNHAHVLLVSGQRSIEELLPGITDELFAARGPIPVNPCARSASLTRATS